jgi:peptide/nickel transport system permease protein
VQFASSEEGPALTRYLVYRLGLMLASIFVVSAIVFFLVRLKGDPVSVMAPPYFNEQQRAALRKAWGFDKPLLEQYVIFLRKAATGDFGKSVAYKTDAMALVMERLGKTYLLALVASLLALLLSVPAGILSAVFRGGVLDFVVTFGSSLGMAMPAFWLGIVLILIFSVTLKILPAFGAQQSEAIILPALALGVGMAANLSRFTRSAMLEVLTQPYIVTARAKGLRENIVIWRHALRNALIAVLTAFGLQLGWLLGGAVVVEKVFAWPGLGRLMVDAVTLHRDVTIVQAGLLWFSLTFLLINLIVDVIYTALDPRIRLT